MSPRSQIPDDTEYAFKHSLIREVAYAMLPRTERRILHAQLADWIEERVRGRLDEYLDLLAFHAGAAEQKDRALGYLVRAAERARRAAANREEAALLLRAIALAKEKSDASLLSGLHAKCGRAWAAVATYPKARAELEETLQRSRATRRPKYQAAALSTKARALVAKGRVREAIVSFREAVDLARPVGDPALFLRTTAGLLAVEGDDRLLTEAREAAMRIRAALSGDEALRARFDASEMAKAARG